MSETSDPLKQKILKLWQIQNYACSLSLWDVRHGKTMYKVRVSMETVLMVTSVGKNDGL